MAIICFIINKYNINYIGFYLFTVTVAHLSSRDVERLVEHEFVSSIKKMSVLNISTIFSNNGYIRVEATV